MSHLLIVALSVCATVIILRKLSSVSIVELEVRDGDASGGSFVIQDCFNFPRYFVFPYEADCCSFKVCEKLC